MKSKQNTKQRQPAWKKLALTSEELEGMPKDKIQVHLSEQVTTPMPWMFSWFGRHWKKILLILSILISMGIIIGLVVWSTVASEVNLGEWILETIIKGFGKLLNWFFIKIVGWAWFVIPGVTVLAMLVMKSLIKRDKLAICRYGTEKIKEYALVSTEEGYVLGVSRESFFGTLILGKAKAQISASTWEYIQQNAKDVSHDPLGERTREYKLLYVQPEERSKEPIFIRINRELNLNPKALIRQKDAQEIILQNIDKTKGEQIDNNKILYNLTEDLHDQLEVIGDLSVKVRSVPRSKIQKYIKAMTPETTELFYDTYNLLKDKLEDLTPFDSIEAELEAMSKEKTKETDEIE